ncbi:hypothetical protein Lfu02_53480 [Longispora fulva]|uniref:Uncharacterized protein n=1 Tax=Longispora fulva TaxID=619741 RepID=A0A8J7KJT7_9ACTN|nr:hypothetical protein [Longispora fulva]MBG6140760.1 hypothetical protein [Longispora fulva]GIG60976.1 hypothetical protein Lfu02_53480 [Longispora fulva]
MTERYAALIRPVIDRVYSTARAAGRKRGRAVIERFGVHPGFVLDYYFGLLARPLSADGLAAGRVYQGPPDLYAELAAGIAVVVDDGSWRLTDLGRAVALAVQDAAAEGAAELWALTPVGTMPGLAGVPRLAELVGILLAAGAATGGPAFAALSPVFEPADASPALLLLNRLGALRHHRADAHKAAWAAAGLTAAEVRELGDGPVRAAIEADTNRRDAPVYGWLTEDERLELLAGLGALAG